MKISYNDFLFLKKTLKKNTKVEILSESMEPFLYKDNIVEISPFNIASLKPGDPIVYWNKSEKLICHMFIHFKELDNKKYLITKGLNNKFLDKPTPSDYYLGALSKPRFTLFYKILFKVIIYFSHYKFKDQDDQKYHP